MAGKWWYWSEQIQPTVSPGQTVNAGQVVATFAPTGTGIGFGWWEPTGGYPLGHDDRGNAYAEGPNNDQHTFLNRDRAPGGVGLGNRPSRQEVTRARSA